MTVRVCPLCDIAECTKHDPRRSGTPHMTAERRAALVESVARETCDAVNGAGAYDETLDIHQDAVWKPIATAAVNLVRAETLEEAAKACDVIEDKLTQQWKAGYKVCDYTQGASDGANDCAAAIRAMKGEA